MNITKNKTDYKVTHKGTITYFSICCTYNYHQNKELAAINQNEGVQKFLTKY